MIFPTLYKRDSAGRVRVWFMELEGSQYRTHAGIQDGSLVASEWTQAVAASQDTDEAQARFEVDARYTHQLAREYHESVGTIDQPKFFKPMLAKTFTAKEASSGRRWFSQPKLDGIRCIARADGLFSRQGQPITAVPHIHAALAPLFAENPDLVLDGELYSHEFREDFGEISSIVRKKNPTAEQLERAAEVMQYHVYDLPSEGFRKFEDRDRQLAQLLERLNCPWIVKVRTTLCHDLLEVDHAYSGYLTDGYEGQMLRPNAPYEQKRSASLLKRKEFQSREYPVEAILPGVGNWASAAKSIQLRNDNGTQFGAGIRGNKKQMEDLLKAELGPNALATVRFFELTPDGVPRFPVVTDIHPQGRLD